MQTGNEEVWRVIFGTTEGHPKLKQFQRFHMWWPSPPRCKMCFVPFGGIGGAVMRWRGKGPSYRNPRYCNKCDAFIAQFPGGAEVELSILFVDVRSSVGLAERLGPTAYSAVMNEFFRVATQSLIDTDGFVIEFIGDAVAAVYPPGFCGPGYARNAIAGAEHLIRSKMPIAPDGTELRVGVGVHTGTVFIGTVAGADGEVEGTKKEANKVRYRDVQPLGDNVNVASRLSSIAEPSQALISEATLIAAGCNIVGLQARRLDLKGRTLPITAYAIGGNTARLAA